MAKVFHLLLFTTLISLCMSEVRFCYKGPHIVSKAECPYGVIFNERIKLSCLVQHKDSKSTGSTKYVLDLCDKNPPVDIPDAEPETKGVWVQKITFDDYQPPEKFRGINYENGSCADECMAESEFIVNNEEDDPVAEHIDEYPPRTPEIDQDQADISARLFPHLTYGSQTGNFGPKLKIFALLTESANIMKRYCGEPWISDFFWKQVEDYMRWMIVNLSKYKLKDMGHRDYENVAKILETCKIGDSSIFFEKSGPACGKKKAFIRHIGVNCTGVHTKLIYRIYPKSFRWGKFDPFIESAWTAIDFVHSTCYKYFLEADQLNLYHLYQQHLQELFPDFVIQRWIYPAVLKKGESYWNILANVYDMKTVMHNLQFCAQAAVHYSPFSKRLDRPFATPNQEGEDYLKGWTHGANTYFHEYRQLGGFSAIVKSFGHCLTSQSLKEAVEKEIETTQC